MSTRIRSLHIYPVKSCAGIDLAESIVDRAGLAHDRRWMVTTAAGQFMTQRQYPQMARIRTALEDGMLVLRAPGMEDLRIPADGSELAERTQPVGVWRDTVIARAEHPRSAEWLSRFLGLPCRLLKIDLRADRTANPEWVDTWLERHPEWAEDFAGDHFFGFADGFPLLVANQSSLDELNERLAARGQAPVPMNRFRANIVVEGDWPAFEEDQTACIVAGGVRMAFVKPCTRCPMSNVDQVTAEVYDELGLTLTTFRSLEIGVVFGQNAIVDRTAPAPLRVGDAVEIELDFLAPRAAARASAAAKNIECGFARAQPDAGRIRARLRGPARAPGNLLCNASCCGRSCTALRSPRPICTTRDRAASTKTCWTPPACASSNGSSSTTSPTANASTPTSSRRPAAAARSRSTVPRRGARRSATC